MWIVRLPVGRDQHCIYGPIADRGEAERFAAYLSAEVDPAFVEPLCSPLGDLLTWREHVKSRDLPSA